MKPPEIFKLAVRILGLVFLYHGLFAVPLTIVQILSAFSSKNIPQIFFTILMAVWPLIIAWWLLRGAAWLVRLAYPETSTTPKEPAVEKPLTP